MQPRDVDCQPLNMHAVVTRDPGGLRLSKTSSFVTIRDQLAEKRRLDYHGIDKSMVDFDQ